MMNIIAVDDEELALNYLVRILKEAQPESKVTALSDIDVVLACLKNERIDIVFLDIEMYGMNGIELAKQIKEVQPLVNVIFVTGFPQYAVDAFSLRASGYLLKPASVEGIQKEIANLRNKDFGKKKVRVQTFGNFEVFYEGIPMGFGRGKTKELFAYLVDRKGAGCTTAELSAVLWEDKEYSVSVQKQFQTLVSDLVRMFRRVEEEGIIIKKRNFLSVNVEKFDCDYYNFLNGNVIAINSYLGEYMSNYSWAEFTTGLLYQRIQTNS